jgi:hypothetical protein
MNERAPPFEPSTLLERLAHDRRHADQAAERLNESFRRCVEAGCRTIDIATALGVSKAAVSMRRRKLKEG